MATIKHLKSRNRAAVLRMIATKSPISRVDIAGRSGLTKMTVTNLVNELIETGFVEEYDSVETISYSPGRKPLMLRISRSAPTIVGVLIKRGLARVILSDLSGEIFDEETWQFRPDMTADDLITELFAAYDRLIGRSERPVMAIGIACVGPLDTHTGTVLNPPYFYGIKNLPLRDIVSEHAKVPVYLINDANAGALAEKVYGSAQEEDSFVYLHIMNGIGAGFVLDGMLYNGVSGRSGEIGHTSISFAGPRCACGNVGCLDLYANMDQMRTRIDALRGYFPFSPLTKLQEASWRDIVRYVDEHDPVAIAALEEFCGYIAYALVDMIKLLDITHLIVGYNAMNSDTQAVETLLRDKLAALGIPAEALEITHSRFGGNASLLGSVAVVAEEVFATRFDLFNSSDNDDK